MEFKKSTKEKVLPVVLSLAIALGAGALALTGCDNAGATNGQETISSTTDTTDSTTYKNTTSTTTEAPNTTTAPPETAPQTEAPAPEKVFNAETAKEIAANIVRDKGYTVTLAEPMLLHVDTQLYSCTVKGDTNDPGYGVIAKISVDPHIDPNGRIVSVEYVFPNGKVMNPELGKAFLNNELVPASSVASMCLNQ